MKPRFHHRQICFQVFVHDAYLQMKCLPMIEAQDQSGILFKRFPLTKISASLHHSNLMVFSDARIKPSQSLSTFLTNPSDQRCNPSGILHLATFQGIDLWMPSLKHQPSPTHPTLYLMKIRQFTTSSSLCNCVSPYSLVHPNNDVLPNVSIIDPLMHLNYAPACKFRVSF